MKLIKIKRILKMFTMGRLHASTPAVITWACTVRGQVDLNDELGKKVAVV
jgi:hypothetical protein